VKEEYRKEDLSQDPGRFAKRQYQPNVVKVAFKCLFRKFSDNKITYQLGKHFGGFGKLISIDLMSCQRTTLVSC
jgi:hypothetical protein